MKILVKIYATFLTLILCTIYISAQEYKVLVGQAEKILITKLDSKISIEGYDGNELIINVTNLEITPERTNGLKSLFDNRIDNTGIGLYYKIKNKLIEFTGLSRHSEDAEYVFLVPRNISVSIIRLGPNAHKNIIVKNINGEIDVKTHYGDIEFYDITGPAVLYNIDGDITGTFGKLNQENPTSLTTINGFLDISLFADTKANVKMNTSLGEIFTDLDIKYDIISQGVGGRAITGTLNGGGVDFFIAAINQNIYLRKK